MTSRRILFFLRHAGYLRHYAEPIRILAGRGHTVHVAFSQLEKDAGDTQLAERLVAEHPNVTYGAAPRRAAGDGWRGIAFMLRSLLDAARYSDPRYADADRLRARVLANLERSLSRAALDPVTRRLARLTVRGAHRLRGERGTGRLVRLLMLAERAVPASREIDQYVRAVDPDVVAVSPVIELGSTQVEFVKSAQHLHIPTAVCVASWDNLTGKGLIRLVPDRVLVWNEEQRREAVEMHRIPYDRIVLTGAQRFDPWFEQKPTRAREEHASALGLDPARPIVLYLCSSPFIAPDEVTFVERWLRALRAAPDEVGSVGVHVRPHPQNAKQWRRVDLSDLGAVVSPPAGAQPDDGDARAAYFDSLFHSAAVVGVNTSALIEAAIVGRDVFTIVDGTFRGSQEGTLHFHYLRAESGGFLHEAASLDEHVRQLAEGLADRGRPPATGFVERFVRPHGIDHPAAPFVADALEELAGTGRSVQRTPAAALALRAALAPAAAFAGQIVRGRDRPRIAPEDRRAPPAKSEVERRLGAELKRLARARGPLMAGPWPDGVESELLVWIPFLRQLVRRRIVSRDELVAVTGPERAPWYADAAARTSEEGLGDRVLRADLVLDLLEDVRAERAPIRSLSGRLDYDRVAAPNGGAPVRDLAGDAATADPAATTKRLREASAYVGAWGSTAALAITLGVPTVGFVSAGSPPRVEIDLAYRAARRLGVPLALVATDAVGEAAAFIAEPG